MKRLIVLGLCFVTQFCLGQNLVSNWSFEDTVVCPSGIGQISRAIGWSSFRNTPDYYNSCNISLAGVPSNNYGFQNSRTGNAYAGFVPYAVLGPQFREIIGTALNQTLIVGQKYFLSFFVNRAFQNTLHVNIAVTKIGARFSTMPYSTSNPVPIDNFSHIFSDSVILDTVNWVKIYGSFIADSAYGYMGIGNFFNDSATTHVLIDSTASSSYYYLDDIRLSTDSDFVNSIQKYSSETVNVFPNPSRECIEVTGNNIESINLSDVLGRRVYTSNSEIISPAKINVSSFSKGIYFLQVKTRETSFLKKIIIQ